MGKGAANRDEQRSFTDETTGIGIRQITSHPSHHHHPFFMIPAYADGGRYLIFISHRTGKPQLYAEEEGAEAWIQLTDRDDLSEWSIHPSPSEPYVYYTAGSQACRVNIRTLEEEALLNLGDVSMKEAGMVAAAMGTTALSRSGRWWALRYGSKGDSCLLVVDTHTGAYETILRRDDIAHIQFCPDDDNLIFYAGPLTDRVWCIRRDGTEHRRLYARDKGKKEWITHESWVPGTGELAFIDWPKAVRAVHPHTLAVRTIAAFNAWHASFSPHGDYMVADTNFPDIGIQLVHLATGRRDTVCFPCATNRGDHWAGPFPYDNGPIQVYAPQHTHPHPSFHPSGLKIVFTSDRDGWAHLYEANLETLIN